MDRSASSNQLSGGNSALAAVASSVGRYPGGHRARSLVACPADLVAFVK